MRRLAVSLSVILLALLPSLAGAQPVAASYIYTLSSFTGSIRYDFSRIAVDRERNEVYVLYQNAVRVFNDSGMEVYRFGEDADLGQIADVAVDERGDILLLTLLDSRTTIIRCDYRGRPQSEIALTGLPPEFSDFSPNRMAYRREHLYLASTMGLKVLTADRQGHFVRGVDLFPLFELEEKDRGTVELGGFGADDEGNILLTAPVLFRAFVLAPDGTLRWFGKASSAPGGFNIAGGIVRDRRGNVLVVDRLKGSVLIFDPKLVFVTQFSTRGYKANQLLFPADLTVDDHDRVYVTQMGRRGVSVFKLAYR